MATSYYLAIWLAMLAATYLAHSTLLLGGAWLIVTACRVRSHALRERIWKVASVAGFVTATLQSMPGFGRPLAAFDFGVLERPAAVQDIPQESASVLLAESRNDSQQKSRFVHEGILFRESRGSTSILETTGVGHERPETRIAVSSNPSTVSRSDRPLSIASMKASKMSTRYAALMGAVVAAWVALGAAWLAMKAWWFGHVLATAQALSAGCAKESLDRLLHLHATGRKATLLSSTECTTPLACGLLRWTIVLPAGAENRLRSDELGALLAHEVAHLARGDLVWLWVGQFLTTCFGFQPLNRIAFRGWQEAAEYLCDDWAVERLGDPLSLARCLTQVASWRFLSFQPASGLAIGGTKATLADRVERLLEDAPGVDPWSRGLSKKGVLVATMAAIAAFACWAPQARCSSVEAAGDYRAPVSAGGVATQETENAVPMRANRTSVPDSDELRANWRALQADLARAEALLVMVEHGSETKQVAQQIVERAVEIDRRLKALDLSVHEAGSFKEE